MTSPTATPTFAAPGPGGWKSLGDHFPGALTAEYQRLYAETCPAGMAAYMARYGVLARTLDVAFVHGHLYVAPVPLAGPRDINRTPPAAAIWLLSRLHPAFRTRTRAATWALATRPWRDVTRHWFAVERQEWIDRNEAVQAVTVDDLHTSEFIEHLSTCRSLVASGYRRHFELHGDDLLPIGLLIARCAEWNIDAVSALRALDGASPKSACPDEPPSWQLVTGYDLDSSAWCELSNHAPPHRAPKLQSFDLQPLVAADHHEELAGLVADARAAVPLRDDNGAITAAWPMGLLRRAMLDAGRRLGLADPTLAIEATVDELVKRLEGETEPSKAALEQRRDDRQRRSQLDAPGTLGSVFPIPPLDALPRPLALMGAAQLATADQMMDVATATGVGNRSYTGRALVVDDPVVAIGLMEPGDIIVTTSTSPTWNVILAQAGAIVTTTGGLLSHAAILARELDIPAVLGDSTAMRRFETGMVVTVDPDRALVTATRAGSPTT